MAITFYCGSGSPPAWRVWLALEHKELPYELNMLSFAGGDLRSEAFAKLNPRQKVPVLVDDDFTLYESVAIVEYLEERYPTSGHGPLFPPDVMGRAIVRRLIQEVDHYLSAAMGRMLREIFYKPEGVRDREVISEGRAKLASELRLFEGQLQGEYFAGRAPTAADFSLYPMLALALRADLKDTAADVRSLVGPKLGAWMRRIEALPYFEATVPPHWRAG